MGSRPKMGTALRPWGSQIWSNLESPILNRWGMCVREKKAGAAAPGKGNDMKRLAGSDSHSQPFLFSFTFLFPFFQLSCDDYTPPSTARKEKNFVVPGCT